MSDMTDVSDHFITHLQERLRSNIDGAPSYTTPEERQDCLRAIESLTAEVARLQQSDKQHGCSCPIDFAADRVNCIGDSKSPKCLVRQNETRRTIENLTAEVERLKVENEQLKNDYPRYTAADWMELHEAQKLVEEFNKIINRPTLSPETVARLEAAIDPTEYGGEEVLELIASIRVALSEVDAL